MSVSGPLRNKRVLHAALLSRHGGFRSDMGENVGLAFQMAAQHLENWILGSLYLGTHTFVFSKCVSPQAFELATGDYLFEPHSGEEYSRDEGNYSSTGWQFSHTFLPIHLHDFSMTFEAIYDLMFHESLCLHAK